MADAATKLSPEAAALMEGFRRLSKEEQRQVAREALVLAEPPELSTEWKREISNRLKSIEDGTAVLLDGDAVMSELRAKYGS